jgi:glyoxylase-like metal-dependent hydrolase (beta-lactamase superfamily II)
VRILALVAPVFGTSCYLLVADDGACVVVDPGGGAAPLVERAVAEHGLRVVGVLATHGHPDHVWDAAAVAGVAGVPLRLHAGDAAAAIDPLHVLAGGAGPASLAVGGALADALRSAGRDPGAYEVPVIEVFGEVVPEGGRSDDVPLDLGGIRVLARHAPGHTPGSTLYLVEVDGAPVVLTGDVLFAGSVGRTDLRGGDPAVMERTLREVVRALPADAHVLPGHGPATRTDVERRTNPYLAG